MKRVTREERVKKDVMAITTITAIIISLFAIVIIIIKGECSDEESN